MNGPRNLILTMLCVLLPATGCDNGSPVPSGGDTYYTSISRRTTVVPENDAFYLHHIAGDEYVFYSWNEQEGIDRERFVTGTGLGGYLRWITGVRREGRFYYAMTCPAYFTEVFRRGLFDASFDRITGGAGESSVDLSGMDLYVPSDPLDGTGVRIEDGHIAFCPEVSVRIGVTGEEVREMAVAVDGPLDFYSSITADLKGAFEIQSVLEMAVFSKRQVLYYSYLPVVVDVDISFTATIDASGAFCDSCRYDLRSSGTVSTGAVYSGGSWGETDGTELDFAATTLACSDHADGRITIGLVPRISIGIYGRPAFTLEASQRQSLYSSTGTLPDWTWDISGGPCNRFAFHEGILGGGVPCFETPGRCDSTALQSGPYRSGGYILVVAWGTEGSGQGEFLFPSGIAAGPDGSIYVCDRTAN
ncbi:MAG TPA: hypothetical protein VLA34_09505, partial [Candidatus Krumholzibacterium sp.]|nr:hypothetical protein [Candidatus Krumholzibacterium sp.]